MQYHACMKTKCKVITLPIGTPLMASLSMATRVNDEEETLEVHVTVSGYCLHTGIIIMFSTNIYQVV